MKRILRIALVTGTIFILTGCSSSQSFEYVTDIQRDRKGRLIVTKEKITVFTAAEIRREQKYIYIEPPE